PARVDGLLLHTPFLRPALIRPAIRLQLALLASPIGGLFGPLRRSTLLATAHRLLFANAAEVEAPQLAHDQADLLRADVRAGRELARDLLRTDRDADWLRNLDRDPRATVRVGTHEIAVRREPITDEAAALRELIELWRTKYGQEWVADWYVERGRVPVRLRLVKEDR